MRVRAPVVVLLVVVALASAAPPSAGAGPAGRDQPCGVSRTLVPSCGAWWGTAAYVRPGETLDAAMSAAEARLGRSLDIVHNYHRWDDVFPSASELRRSGRGQLLLLAWSATRLDGSRVPWADIASGREDAVIDAAAARLAALGRRLFLTFNHEPEDDVGRNGSAADYVAAFRHIHRRLASEGVSNVVWVWTVMGLTNAPWPAAYGPLYPGPSYVDWIGWDPYNWASCRQRAWRSFRETVQPFYNWLIGWTPASGKPFMLAEYGTVEDPADSTHKARWYSNEVAALRTMPRLHAVVYFDFPAPPGNCEWRSDTTTASADAFATAAQGRYVNQPLP